MGEIAVIGQKAMHADNGMNSLTTVVADGYRAFANPVHPSRKHLGIGVVDGFGQIANVTCLHYGDSYRRTDFRSPLKARSTRSH